LEGVEGYENIHYHVSNIQQYAGKKVTILGGGDSAVDWALAFEKIAPTTLVHRRDNFRALEHSVQALQESSVTIKTPFVPSQLLGDGKTLDKL
ncbi:NAD-binding protein, partial [Faecalimonas umbilicata]|nr:NAD-binding protein [Faecalimonas umbilicata]